jgi:hypothetical protein
MRKSWKEEEGELRVRGLDCPRLFTLRRAYICSGRASGGVAFDLSQRFRRYNIPGILNLRIESILLKNSDDQHPCAGKGSTPAEIT